MTHKCIFSSVNLLSTPLLLNCSSVMWWCRKNRWKGRCHFWTTCVAICEWEGSENVWCQEPNFHLSSLPLSYKCMCRGQFSLIPEFDIPLQTVVVFLRAAVPSHFIIPKIPQVSIANHFKTHFSAFLLLIMKVTVFFGRLRTSRDFY